MRQVYICLTKPWKIKANHAAIEETKKLIAEMMIVRFEWVKGHAGHIGNEAADKLAGKGSRSTT